MGRDFKVLLIVLLAGLFIFQGAAYAQSGKTIKVGVIGPMKFNMGEHAWYGATLAAEEINAEGGVLVRGERRKIQLVKEDSNELRSIVDAVSAMERLITVEKVNFMVGGARSEATLAQQEVMADNKVIFMAPPVSPELSIRLGKDYNKYKYWFRTLLNSNYYGVTGTILVSRVAEMLRRELGIEKPKVALLMSKLLFVDPIVKFAQEKLEAMGLEVVGVWRNSHQATDITAELTAIKASGAQIIYQMSSSSDGTAYSRQWGELQIPAVLVGTNLEAMRKGHWEATGGMCNYEILDDYFAPAAATERSIPFWNKMLKTFNDYPQDTTSVYDAIHIVRGAIERAGTLDPDRLVSEIEKTDYQGAIGRCVYSGKDSKTPHELTWGPKYISRFGLQWRDGGLVPVWPDGKALPPAISQDQGWQGLRYKGTQDIVLPPWVVQYWKDRKK